MFQINNIPIVSHGCTTRLVAPFTATYIHMSDDRKTCHKKHNDICHQQLGQYPQKNIRKFTCSAAFELKKKGKIQ